MLAERPEHADAVKRGIQVSELNVLKSHPRIKMQCVTYQRSHFLFCFCIVFGESSTAKWRLGTTRHFRCV